MHFPLEAAPILSFSLHAKLNRPEFLPPTSPLTVLPSYTHCGVLLDIILHVILRTFKNVRRGH